MCKQVKYENKINKTPTPLWSDYVWNNKYQRPVQTRVLGREQPDGEGPSLRLQMDMKKSNVKRDNIVAFE